MKVGRYLVAGLGFALLMTGGIVVGLWASGPSGSFRAGNVELGEGDRLTLVVLGDAGGPGPTARQRREVAADWCNANDCDGVVLVGELRPPGGATDPDDPQLDEIIAPYAAIGPTVLMPGYQGLIQPGRTEHLVRWAHRHPDVHLPAPAWTAAWGPATLLALDAARLPPSEDPADPQRAWLDSEIRKNAAPWLVLGLPAARLPPGIDPCDRAAVVLHRSANRTLIQQCGVTWIGAGGPHPVPAAAGVVHEDANPGFVTLQIDRERIVIRYLGLDSQQTFAAQRARDGSLSLMDGTVLFAAE